jgi:hypothetical protein
MLLLTGISQWDTSGTPPRYLSSTHLSARVGGLNPRWNQVLHTAAAPKLWSSVPRILFWPYARWLSSEASRNWCGIMHHWQLHAAQPALLQKVPHDVLSRWEAAMKPEVSSAGRRQRGD